MLEFVAVFLLARYNGDAVEAKGQRGTAYRWATAGLWFGGEILGYIVAAAMLGPHTEALTLYLWALGGAVTGAVLSVLIARRVPEAPMRVWQPNAMTPPGGTPGWLQPNPALQPAILLPGNVGLIVEARTGDWAQVAAFNGWRGYVDARLLVPLPAPQPAPQAPVWQ